LTNVLKSRIASGAGLARALAQVVSEPIFDIPRLVEAARHQRFDPILGGGSPEAFGVSNRPFVEPGDPGRGQVLKLC
jgi:hypothetical protein